MNIVITSRLLKNSALILSLLGSSLLLSACGGGSNNKPSLNLSSKSSSFSSHSFSSVEVSQPNSGVWPYVKVSANKTKTLTFTWSDSPAGTTSFKLFKKADDSSAYTQVGADFTATSVSDDVSVHLTDWVNSRYQVQACNDTTGCVDSKEIKIDNVMLDSITYVKASNTDSNDWFGWSVAISADGKTMAVGAPGESSNACGVNATDISTCDIGSSTSTSSTGPNGNQQNNDSPSSGAVYVFIKVDGVWQQEAYIKASNTEQPNDNPYMRLPNDRFGYQIALSADGNTLAVSAINEDSYSTGVNCDQHDYTYAISSDASSSVSSGYSTYRVQSNSGAVYVFKRVDNAWSQQAYIKPPTDLGLLKNGAFGGSIAISGDGKTLAIGQTTDWLYSAGIQSAPSSSSSSCKNFSLSSLSTSSSSSSSSSSTETNSSGSSTSVPGGPNSGAVYMYKLTDDGWQPESYLKASNAGRDSIGSGDEFGTSLSLTDDGNLLAVGATGEDSSDSTEDGTITLDGLAPDGVTIIKGVTNPLNSGAVYVFERADGAWSQQAKVKPTTNGWYQMFGSSVSLSGDGTTLAVGTPGDWSKSQTETDYVAEASVTYDSNRFMYLIFPKANSSYGTGAVYIFRRSGSSWPKEAYLKASAPLASYQFGLAVSLSHDGNTVAVGSFAEASSAVGVATGTAGDQTDTSSTLSGAAWSFTRTGNTWTHKNYIKAPNSNMQDRFAHSLMLDGLGDTLLIGAHREASNAVGINGDETNNSADASGAAYLY